MQKNETGRSYFPSPALSLSLITKGDISSNSWWARSDQNPSHLTMLLHGNLSRLSIRGCLSPLPHGYFSKTLTLEPRPLFGRPRVLFSSGAGDLALGNRGVSQAGRAKTAVAVSWADAGERKEKVSAEARGKSRSSSWERSAERFFNRKGDNHNSTAERMIPSRDAKFASRDGFKLQEEKEEFVDQPVEKRRQYRIRDGNKYRPNFKREHVPKNSRFSRGDDDRQWERRENWGKKAVKEPPSESTVPRMVGQGVYGVGPILAALTAARREFHTLYVQENMDLSVSNKKKKDRKVIVKILEKAKEIGIRVVETSKHDLNMVTENRPHQGLVLDASPLEMIGIKELEAVNLEQGEKAPIWVALDEVTDPQNLGAIMRSAYYFGASGVVLCAKNSAPLTGVVSKASAGSLELIELRSCKNMMLFLSGSAGNGWRVLGGSVSDKAVSITEIGGNEPTLLVLGSEGTGLRPLVERSCTGLVRIPGIPDTVSGLRAEEENEVRLDSFLAVESLNVSVAAGVLLYHLINRNS